VGCLKAWDCGYCHLCNEGEIKRRKKAKVIMLRLAANKESGPVQDIEANDADENSMQDPDTEHSQEGLPLEAPPPVKEHPLPYKSQDTHRDKPLSQELRITVKNTFIHLETFDPDEALGGFDTNIEDKLNGAGIVFSVRGPVTNRLAMWEA